MSIERMLQIGVAMMATLGTLILGMGQPSPVLPAIVIGAAVVSLIVTDIYGWFRLNRVLGNCAALLAAVYSLSNFFHYDPQRQLLSIAHLLVYLQVVLLFQQKTARIYWELAVLSLLQVVVAAALNLGVAFAFVLVPYIFVAITTLVLFYLYREGEMYSRLERGVRRLFPRRSRRMVEKRSRANSADETHGQTPPPVFVGSFPFPHALAEAILDARPQTTPVKRRGSPLDVLVGRRLISQCIGVAVAAAIFMIVMFFATPRHQKDVWQGPLRDQKLVGFTDTVTLNEMADLLESDEPVMRVWLTDQRTGEPYRSLREPYFQGVTLTNYSFLKGKAVWSRAVPVSRARASRLHEAPPTVAVANGQSQQLNKVGQDIVRQDIVVQPFNGGETLFGIFPVWSADETESEDVMFDPRSYQMFYADFVEQPLQQPFRYSIVTTGFYNEWQLPITPPLTQLHRKRRQLLLLKNISDYNSDFSRFRQLSQKILKDEDVDVHDRTQIAYALERYLQNEQKFHYTLKLSEIKRTPGMDPLEDFLFNHRSGHCEYFAGALTLMLRSVGIPARLVVGFKGAEYNPLGAYYQVRQSHAHAWVEAYLRPEDLPQIIDGRYASMPTENGAWLRLDPTPGQSELLGAESRRDVLDHVTDLFDYAQFLWTDYVLGMNKERQVSALQDPLGGGRAKSISQAIKEGRWKTVIKKWGRAIGVDLSKWVEGDAFGWSILIAAIVLCLCGLSGRLLLRKFSGVFSRTRHGRSQSGSRSAPVIEFYVRLEKTLSRWGVHRDAQKTQKEFADLAGERLREAGAEEEIASLPLRIVEAFYQVRFGNQSLDSKQQHAIENALANLEAALFSSSNGKAAVTPK